MVTDLMTTLPPPPTRRNPLQFSLIFLVTFTDELRSTDVQRRQFPKCEGTDDCRHRSCTQRWERYKRSYFGACPDVRGITHR